MARSVWHDQPDYYTTATLPRFWTEAHADAEVAAGEGYLGGAALTGATEDAYVLTLSTGLSDSVEFGVGCRLKIDALPAADKIIFGITTTGGELQCCLSLNTDGTVSLWRGAMTTLLATSTDALATGSQLRLGMTGIIDEANGAIEAWRNRDPIARVNGINTAGASPSTWGGVYVGLAPDLYHSHLYAQAGYADLRPGYVVRVLRPTIALFTGYAPSGAASIPEAIDDPTPDDDASYIYASAIDRRYCVEHDALVAADTRILGTRMIALVRNISGSSPSFAPLIRNANGHGVDVHPWRSVVSTAWRAIDRWDQRNPFTEEPWTAAEVNACGWGGETDV